MYMYGQIYVKCYYLIFYFNLCFELINIYVFYILNVCVGCCENYYGGLEDRKLKFKWVFVIDEKVGDWLDQEFIYQQFCYYSFEVYVQFLYVIFQVLRFGDGFGN